MEHSCISIRLSFYLGDPTKFNFRRLLEFLVNENSGTGSRTQLQMAALRVCILPVFPSSKAISKAYEEYVLSAGNLDERIFLGEEAEEEIGTLSRCLNTGSATETAERAQMKSILQRHFDRVSRAGPEGQREQAAEGLLYSGSRVCMRALLASSTKKKIHILPIAVEKVISVFIILTFVDIDFHKFWLDLQKRI